MPALGVKYKIFRPTAIKVKSGEHFLIEDNTDL